MKDKEAKAILGRWIARSMTWEPEGTRGYWMRARPRTNDAEGPRMPYLCPTATTDRLTTQPDGLYVRLEGIGGGSPFADVMAIEVSGSRQNLSDKRARYSANGGAKRLFIPLVWLENRDTFQGGKELALWEASGWFESKPEDDLVFAIRHCTVLFAVPKELYEQFKSAADIAYNEHFCDQEMLDKTHLPGMRSFLKKMMRNSHFIGPDDIG